MGSKKIIVPQGLINPNETTIIEIPRGIDNEATLIARSTPSEYMSCSNGKGKSKTVPKTASKCSLMITKVTSTTVFDPDDDCEETVTPARNKEFNSTRSMYRSCQPSPYQDESRPLTPKSSRYQESYLEQQSSGYESYQASGRPPKQCVPNKNVCDDTTCPVVNMLESRKSLNPNSGYVSNAASYSQNQGGAVPYSSFAPSSRYANESSYYGGNQTGYQSPRPRIKKIVRKVVTETPSYSAQTTARLGYQQTGRDTNRFSPMASSTRRNDSYEDPAEPSYSDSSRSCTKCAQSKADQNQQPNLKTQVERHLAEIEESERQKINRDLAVFQQARRRLVEDATNISSGESSLQFPKN